MMKATSPGTQKSLKTLLAAVAALTMGAACAQAQFTYVDAIDFSLHPDGPLGNPLNFPGNENTFLDDGGGNKVAPWTTDTSGTANLWRYRNTGPANVAAGTNAYEGRLNDDELFTVVGGLNAGDTYTIMLYGVWTTKNATWGLSWSADEGSSWGGIVDSLDIEYAKGLGYGQGWVDADGNLRTGLVYGNENDTRGAIILGTTTVNSSGDLIVGIRAQPNTSSERGVYDGIGYAIGVVPEPTTFALAGLGAAALLIFRRRK